MKHDITKQTDRELELLVDNTESLFRLKEASQYSLLIQVVERVFKYRPEQFTVLLESLVEHKDNHRIDGAK